MVKATYEITELVHAEGELKLARIGIVHLNEVVVLLEDEPPHQLFISVSVGFVKCSL